MSSTNETEDAVHPNTALYLLQDLVRQELLSVSETTFRYVRHPQPVHPTDIRVAFLSLAERMNAKKGDVLTTVGETVDVYLEGRLFEKFFKLLYVNQKLFPVSRSDNLEGSRGRENPLPALFVTSEKTQVRQVPLVETRPWPFKFLLELGGMVVCKPTDKREFLLEMRQYLNNFPQFRMKVHAEEWPAGEILVVTTYFEKLPLLERKGNVNVPS